MKLNLNLKSILKKFHPSGSHGIKASGPDSDWRVIFLVFGSLTIVLLACGLYVFFGVQNGSLFSIPPDQSQVSPRLNSALLQKTVDYYENQAADFKNITASKEVVKDPSR